MKITQENNFCRVFEIPNRFPEGFLHLGPKPVSFNMVDWFNPIPANDIEDGLKQWAEYVEMLREFLSSKNYLKHGSSYILLTDFGESFVFTKGELL